MGSPSLPTLIISFCQIILVANGDQSLKNLDELATIANKDMSSFETSTITTQNHDILQKDSAKIRIITTPLPENVDYKITSSLKPVQDKDSIEISSSSGMKDASLGVTEEASFKVHPPKWTFHESHSLSATEDYNSISTASSITEDIEIAERKASYHSGSFSKAETTTLLQITSPPPPIFSPPIIIHGGEDSYSSEIGKRRDISSHRESSWNVTPGHTSTSAVEVKNSGLPLPLPGDNWKPESGVVSSTDSASEGDTKTKDLHYGATSVHYSKGLTVTSTGPVTVSHKDKKVPEIFNDSPYLTLNGEEFIEAVTSASYSAFPENNESVKSKISFEDRKTFSDAKTKDSGIETRFPLTTPTTFTVTNKTKTRVKPKKKVEKSLPTPLAPKTTANASAVLNIGFEDYKSTTSKLESGDSKPMADSGHYGKEIKYLSDKRHKNVSSTTTTDKPTSSTTVDAQMNDPPWNRGPNVFSEYEPIPKKKLEPKKIKEFEDPVVEISNSASKFHKEWAEAKQVWGVAWDIHKYSMGFLFSLLSFYSFISLLRLRTYVRLFGLGYYVTLNIILFAVGTLRAVYLLYDPYNLMGAFPPIVAHLAFNTVYPCLTSAFLVLFLALLHNTDTTILPSGIQRPIVFAVISILHFSFSITTDIIISIYLNAKILLCVCQGLFLLWSTILSIVYIGTFRKLHHAALRKQGEMIRITFTKLHIDGAQLPKKLPKPTIALAVRINLSCATLLMLLASMKLYGMLCIYGLLIDTKPDPWSWWGYQTASRFVELTLALIISFTGTQPLRHFESDGNEDKCTMCQWFPCSSLKCCKQKEEAFDFETHSDYYANLQFRNCGFSPAGGANSRRWGQTNSLPTFRTPSSDAESTLPLRNLPYTGSRGRNTNHPSALSLLSYYRSKRNLSLSTNDGLDDVERTFGNQEGVASMSDTYTSTIRPSSMLYKDNGFIRFRTEWDPEQPMELSDEEEADMARRCHANDEVEDCDSTKANAGSSLHSLLDDDDVVQNTLSPFFQSGYHRRFRRMSRVSLETTDNSVDLSSEQLSNVTFRNGLSNSVLDFNIRKYGSTCSSESAANSFDVTFFLNGVGVVQQPAYRSETEDEKTSSVDGHEVILRSVSPIITRTARRIHDLPLNLNLRHESDVQTEKVNVSCGTEDITPDSAVYLDLQLTKDTPTSLPPIPPPPPPPPQPPLQSIHYNHDMRDVAGYHQVSPVPVFYKPSSTSLSMGDLRTSSCFYNSKSRRTSRGLLHKLRGSTFSLNATINGYEPLETEDNYSKHQMRRRLRRSSSDRRPQSAEDQQMENSVEVTKLNASTSPHLCHGDSGLLRDCQESVTHVDEASQTDPTEVHVGIMTTCSDVLRLGRSNSDSASLSFMKTRQGLS